MVYNMYAAKEITNFYLFKDMNSDTLSPQNYALDFHVEKEVKNNIFKAFHNTVYLSKRKWIIPNKTVKIF